MRILHVADLHYRQPWFDWVANQAKDFDAVCIAGDLLNIWLAREVPLRAQTKWIRAWARSCPGRLFICTGNHDWWSNDEIVDTDANGGWLRKLSRPEVTRDNHGARLGDYFVYCHAYAARAPFPTVKTERWILLHHEPPAGCAAAIAGDSAADLGNAYLRDQLKSAEHAPWLVLSGHVHRPRSWRGQSGSGTTWVLNPAYDGEASIPNHLVIDFEDGLVTWVSEREGTWPVKVFT